MDKKRKRDTTQWGWLENGFHEYDKLVSDAVESAYRSSQSKITFTSK